MVWYKPSTWGQDQHEQRLLSSADLPRWSDVSAGRAVLYGSSESRALSLVPVFASCRLLAGTVASLPLKTYRDQGDEKVRAPQAQLFAQLEKQGRLIPWLHACMTSLALRGNAYGEIVDRDGYGFPLQIEWLDPTGIVWENSEDRRGWKVGSRFVPETSMVHIPWFTLPGRREGLSPLAAFASTIEGGLEAGRYGADWFANGGFPPGTFKNTQQTVTNDEADVIKVRLQRAINSRQPLVYGADWEYSPVTVPPSEAQFVEAQRLNATQVAAIYGIPPEMVGGETGRSMTYANVEQQQIQFVMMTLRPWLVTLERAFSALLPSAQYVRFNADALIRTDIKTRHEVYQISRAIGLRSLDELRALEELPPLPNGEGASFLEPPAPPPALPPGPGVDPAVRSISDWRRPA